MAVLTFQFRVLTALSCCVALAASAGCRNLDNAQTDVLERELRQQEDYIYELEDYLIEYSEKLRHARTAQSLPASTTIRPSGSKTPLREPTIDRDPVERPSLPLNGRHKLPADQGGTVPAAESVAPPAATEAPPADAPAAQPPEGSPPEAVDPQDLKAPDLEIGPVGASPSGNSSQVAAAPTLPPVSGSDGPLLIPDPVAYQTDAQETPGEQSPTAAVEVASEPRLAAPEVNAPRLSAQQLKIRRVFGEPAKAEQTSGSLLVVVEAVNATDEPVDAVGAASLMIMARDKSGALKRVERWDFTAEETAAAWQSSHLGDGLHLELPLTKSELPEGELELWARVVNDEGVKLLTAADDPYRFEATKLASMADAPTDTAIAATEQPSDSPADTGEAQQTAAADGNAETPVKTAAEPPKPQWRASTRRNQKDRVESFATTAVNQTSGWTTKPIGGSQPRVASAPAKSGSPTWKRSTRAADETASRPEWASER